MRDVTDFCVSDAYFARQSDLLSQNVINYLAKSKQLENITRQYFEAVVPGWGKSKDQRQKTTVQDNRCKDPKVKDDKAKLKQSFEAEF